VFSAAHDLKVEWVIIKGISDYADGTASSTEHWKPFASVMAASVVNYMLHVPVIFDEWPHYQNHNARAGIAGYEHFNLLIVIIVLVYKSFCDTVSCEYS